MAGIYVFKVFLEYHGSAALGERHIGAAQNYFCLRRKSGGGDCGPLTWVFGQIYSIAFRNQKDQQNVLLRPDHIVELPDGPLRFTVKGTLEPDHSSSSHSLPTPAQSLQPNPGSISQPSGEEYELRPMASLLCYLLDCGQAKRELEQELLSLTCSLHLYPDRVLVRRSTQSGAEVEGSIWKAQVDTLFDRYKCHVEVDQQIVMALNQFPSIQQIPDDVKVYHEDSVAVVVGKHAQVDAFLSSLKSKWACLREKDWHFQGTSTSFGMSMETETDSKVTARGATAGPIKDSVHVEVVPDTLKSHQISGRLSEGIPQPEEALTPIRTILLGKTGTGKSTLANTIFGEEGLFPTNCTFTSVTSRCQAETRSVHGRSITLIDTPGLFDTNNPREDIRSHLINGIIECAPGPHAFLIVLKIERFTQQEQEVINEILQIFSDDALQFAILVFTHGDQLPERANFQKLINENVNLSNLVRKCGGRYHIFDNKPGKNKEHRTASSRQVEELMNTINEMVAKNHGGYYTNARLYQLTEDIKEDEMVLIKSSPHLSKEEITRQAKENVASKILIQLTGIATGAIVGAFFGLSLYMGLNITAINGVSGVLQLKKAAMEGINIVSKRSGGLAVAGMVAGAGGIAGGFIGYHAAKTANTPVEAMWSAAREVSNFGRQLNLK